MELSEGLLAGFAAAITPSNLLFCALGTFVGTIVGILPGLGPSATIAILIPVTYGLGPLPAMIMLAGIYYGAKYGGALTSILINSPGESSSVMTCIDGYQMARRGQAGKALGIAAISSFVGGTIGVLGLTFLALPIADVSVSFGPPEYFAMMVLGLCTIVALAGDSIVKALISTIVGLLLGMVGTDPLHGQQRLTFGQVWLIDGIDFIIVAVGVFAISEVLVSADERRRAGSIESGLSGLYPSLTDLRECLGTFLRSSGLGFFLGVLPGAGATISSFIAYGTEKAIAKNRDKFGKGAVQGVAAPESADNAASAGSFVPLLTLGIPGSGSTAIMLAAMMLYGVRPGPLLFEDQPQFVWGIIASMYIGNVMLLIMNLPLVPFFALALRVPYSALYPFILALCMLGVYSLNQSTFQVILMFMFGIVGYIMRKLEFPAAPLVLALVLGPLIDQRLIQSLSMSQGDLSIFITRPWSATMLGIALAVVTIALAKWIAGKRHSGVQTAGHG